MTHQGGCHCGAVRYEVSGEPQHVALCHCSDCRKSSGAPMVAWAAFAEDQFKLLGSAPVTFNSSGSAMRSFLPEMRDRPLLSQRRIPARYRRYPVGDAR
jgi:hypothetical protein